MNLFLIGNGFDLSHKMKTAYSDFRKFLIDRYYLTEDMINTLPDIPYPYTDQDGGECYEPTCAALAIVQMLDATNGYIWKDIEDKLGSLDFGIFLDDYGLYANEDEDENFYKNNYYRNEDNANNLCGALKLIPDYFKSWVDTINIAKTPILDFQNMIDCKNDLFLTFNYTKTLEKLYKVSNICHIHGTKNNQIYFGHGSIDIDSNSLQHYWHGAEDAIEKLHNCLRKETIQAYRGQIDFFKKLYKEASNNKINIYSYGFSFSDVDMIYLENIFRNINTTNTTFYLNDFDDSIKRKNFADLIYRSGFQGNISTFHVNENKISILRIQ